MRNRTLATGESDPIPYRNGEPPPAGKLVLAILYDDDENDLGMFWVDPGVLESGPMRDEDLGYLLPAIRWIYRHLHSHLTWCATLEQWELGFLHDSSPEREVSLWVKATYAYLKFRRANPRVESAAVFSGVYCFLQGREDRVEPKAAADELRSYLGSVPEILCDLENFTADGMLNTIEKWLQ